MFDYHALVVSKVHTATVFGVEGVLITIEVDVATRGFPQCKIVGLPGRQAMETRERIRASFKNANLPFPRRRVVISVLPLNAPKKNIAVDLAVAVGLLVSQGHIPKQFLDNTLFLGTLSLDGTLLPSQGLLPIIKLVNMRNVEKIYFPAAQQDSFILQTIPKVYAVESLTELVAAAQKKHSLTPVSPVLRTTPSIDAKEKGVDFNTIHGQKQAKRAMEIAAVGKHSILLTGFPGVGKTLLAQAYWSILPTPTTEELQDIAYIHSIIQPALISGKRPFVEVSSSITKNLMYGDSKTGIPGEITKAHHGILFLDELADFRSQCLTPLKELLEKKTYSVAHPFMNLTFPANVYFIAAMNPCSCGYYGHPKKPCMCSRNSIAHYSRRISGAIRDRLDLSVHVDDVEIQSSLLEQTESSDIVKRRVEEGYAFQKARNRRYGNYVNAEIPHMCMDKLCVLEEKANFVLNEASKSFSLSMRAYDKVKKVARTIADLDLREKVSEEHIIEALSYR